MSINGIKTNIYRCLEPCKNCPLLDDGKAMHLSEGHVDTIKADLDKGGNFVCHHLLYDHDDRKMCYGAWKYLNDKGEKNDIMQIAERVSNGHIR